MRLICLHSSHPEYWIQLADCIHRHVTKGKCDPGIGTVVTNRRDKTGRQNCHDPNPENPTGTSGHVLMGCQIESSRPREDAGKCSELSGTQILVPAINSKSSQGSRKVGMNDTDSSMAENTATCDTKRTLDICDSGVSELSLRTDTDPPVTLPVSSDVVCDGTSQEASYSKVDAAVCLYRARYLLRCMDPNLTAFAKHKNSKLLSVVGNTVQWVKKLQEITKK